MEKNQTIILVIGLIITIAFLATGLIYYAGIIAIIVGVLYMGFVMNNTSRKFAVHPEVSGHLKDDAKAVIIKNTGNADAVNIHVAVVPLNIEFDVATLKAGEAYEYPVTTMIEEAKAAITYHDPHGKEFTDTNPLSALAGNDEDVLKPMFPTFGWK